MPRINIADKRGRDAVVKAESVSVDDPIRYLGPRGNASYTRRILKSTIDHDIEALSAGNPEADDLADALIETDIDVDMERFGQFLFFTSRVWIGPDDEPVFSIKQLEEVRDPQGTITRTRDRIRDEPNVDSEIPLSWSGTLIPRREAVRRYVFGGKLQIVHVNGLTYDFLHGMAKELSKAKSLMLLGGGKSGKKPLVFRRGSVPYRGFLEGRVRGDRYILLLHLSNMELKRPKAGDASPEPAT